MWPQDLCGTDWESPDVRQWMRNTPVTLMRQSLPPLGTCGINCPSPVTAVTSNTLIQVHLIQEFMSLIAICFHYLYPIEEKALIGH